MLSEYKRTVHGSTAFASAKRLRRAFTLAELVVSMAVFSILAGSTISAILIATKAIPDPSSISQQRMSAQRALNEMRAELFYAVDITSSAVTSTGFSTIEFTVHDRGHGAPGEETIRYHWSGTTGDPLIRQYNGGLIETILEAIDHFEISFSHKVLSLAESPSVLLIVGNDITLDPEDQTRQAQIESWGFTVNPIAATRTDAEFATAIDGADVIYVSEQNATPLPAKVTASSLGIVTEMRSSFSILGISSKSNWVWMDSLDIVDNTHFITEPFAMGSIQVFGTSDYAIYSWQTIAPGGVVLGTSLAYDMLIAVDSGEMLSTGREAPGRRVSLPWGDRTFDFSVVNDAGLLLMKRAIVWAAQRNVHSAAAVRLRLTGDANNIIRQSTAMLNQPRCRE